MSPEFRDENDRDDACPAVLPFSPRSAACGTFVPLGLATEAVLLRLQRGYPKIVVRRPMGVGGEHGPADD